MVQWLNCHGDRGYLSLNALTTVRSDEHKETWAVAYFSKRFKSSKIPIFKEFRPRKKSYWKVRWMPVRSSFWHKFHGVFRDILQNIVREYFRTNGCHWERNSRQRKYRTATEKKWGAWHGMFVNIARCFSIEGTVFKDIALKHVPKNIFKYWFLIKYCNC